METKDKLILYGTFSIFDNCNRSHRTIYYTEEEFEKQLDNLKHQILLESRIKKIKQLLNENKNN